MKKNIGRVVAFLGIGVLSAVPSLAAAQERSRGLNLADNEAMYVDGTSFDVSFGMAKGDTRSEVRALNAREIGAAAIIMRLGNKIYVADAADQMVNVPQPSLWNYANPSDHPSAAGAGSAGYNGNVRRNYAYEPSDNPRAAGGGSAGYNESVRRNYAYEPTDNPDAAGGGSAGYNENVRRNYAYEPKDNPSAAGGGSAGYNESVRRNYAYEPSDNPRAAGGGSAGYNENVRRNYAYEPKDNPGAAGGGSAGYNESVRRNYAYEPSDPWTRNYAYEPGRQNVVVYDPDYALYRMRKEFEAHWSPIPLTASK